MILSPRSLAHRPVLLGVLIFGLAAACTYVVVTLAQTRPSARAQALDERAAELDEERIAEKMRDYTPPKPLCDDRAPAHSAEVGDWLTYLDCLETRHRDPALQLVETTRGLDRWDSAALRERRWRLLAKLGRYASLVETLRAELDGDALSPQRRERARLTLAAALLRHGSEPWADRVVESAALVRESSPATCDGLATAVLALYAAHPSPAARPSPTDGTDSAGLLDALGDYDARGCAQRVDSGDVDVLVEQIGVGVVARKVEGAPASVVEAPRTIASNFTITSTFSTCAEAVPDGAELRSSCREMFDSF